MAASLAKFHDQAQRPRIVSKMNATQMLELLNRSPFQPLEIRLNNGMVIHVEESFAIRAVAHSPTCIAFDDEGIARFIAYRNMAEVVTSDVDVNGASA